MSIIFTVLNNCWPLITLPNLLFLFYTDGYISTGFKKQGAKAEWISQTLILALRKMQLYIPYSITSLFFANLAYIRGGVGVWWNFTQASFDPASSFYSSSVLASEQSFLAYDEAVDKTKYLHSCSFGFHCQLFFNCIPQAIAARVDRH